MPTCKSNALRPRKVCVVSRSNFSAQIFPVKAFPRGFVFLLVQIICSCKSFHTWYKDISETKRIVFRRSRPISPNICAVNGSRRRANKTAARNWFVNCCFRWIKYLSLYLFKNNPDHYNINKQILCILQETYCFYFLAATDCERTPTISFALNFVGLWASSCNCRIVRMKNMMRLMRELSALGV